MNAFLIKALEAAHVWFCFTKILKMDVLLKIWAPMNLYFKYIPTMFLQGGPQILLRSTLNRYMFCFITEQAVINTTEVDCFKSVRFVPSFRWSVYWCSFSCLQDTQCLLFYRSDIVFDIISLILSGSIIKRFTEFPFHVESISIFVYRLVY